MNAYARFIESTTRFATLLQGPAALVTRVYVSWVFLWSGWLKITNWEQTVSLFESEYRVPLLSPFWGAVTGTFGELVFSAFLILGLGGRVPATGLFFVNVMAVVSYWHEFSKDDGIAGLRQHYCWGLMLAMLIAFGSGSWSIDRLLNRRRTL